ncbi:MAG: thiosulfate oxidation carrier complex protein SoxZ [Betaproteobacteria bacterium]|nr:thiosulfate oxidation carrier complex protein SoxZ [Betaproteobacteria bacterium]
MASPMKIRAKLEGDVVQVRVLMAHIMETGLRKNPQGDLIPAHYIQQVSATWKDKIVLSAQWGPAVSANPFISFKFKGGARGDKIRFQWVDNKGDTRTDESVIQ